MRSKSSRDWRCNEMKHEELHNLPVVDCHYHFEHLESENRVLRTMKEVGVKRANLVSVINPVRLNYNPEEICMKVLHSDLFYAFGALDYSAVFAGLGGTSLDLVEQVDNLVGVGFDGIKMAEGKPTYRKILQIPFNSESYEDYFGRVESLDFPLLFHVNDPEEFWNPSQAPSFAERAGWLYDETYPKKEELYAEVKAVLDNHPDLKIIFPHFYYLSGDLERADGLLEEYKNVNLDLGPGSEMYYNFSARREDWREFFIRYQDRILFGADNSDSMSIETALGRFYRVRTFLETDEPVYWRSYEKKKEPLKGFSLPKHVLSKIYCGNFERIAGREPRRINIDAAVEELRRVTEAIQKTVRARSESAPSREAQERIDAVNQMVDRLREMAT